MTALEIKQGHTQSITLQVLASGGGPYNLTGYTVTLVVRAQGQLAKVGTVVSPATGEATFAFSVADYAGALQPGRWTYAVWVSDLDENIPVVSGTLTIVDVPQRV
jgi:hypothetical protein